MVQFVQNNIWLVLMMAVSGGLLVWPYLARFFGGVVPELGTLEAVQLINRRDALVLDVRESAEFAAGHIVHARQIPLSRLADSLHELKKFKERPLLVSCGDGMVSGKACGILRKNGFKEVFRLKGGLAAWQQANLPLEK
ncbi:MAG: rhodanese-like domain-containing protein [Burkholderiales bacterium]